MKKLIIFDSLFFLSLFFLFLFPPTDPDLGWQLRCGEQIWEKHNFCNQNQFSILLKNYSWVNHRWLYQATIFPTLQSSGLWGLTIFNTILMTLSFIFFYLSIKNYVLEKMLAIALIIFLSWGVFSFGIRSQLLGFFFFNLLLWLFSQFKQKPKLIIFFPFIMLIWVNSHGSFLIGLILLTFWWLKEAVRFLYLRQKKDKRRFVLYTLILVLSLTTTLFNPFGLRVYQDAWRHFVGVKLENLIAEWVPPTLLVWWLILSTGIGLFFYLLVANRKRGLINGLLLLSFLLLTLKARRHLPFYFFLASYLFLVSPLTKQVFGFWLKQRELRRILTILALTAFFFVGFFHQLPKTIKTNSSWQNYCRINSVIYPCEAIEFLKKQSGKGNIFNRYEWGGFLIWQLPEYKIFVDGRMPAWQTPSGKSPYTIYLETLQTQPGWQETLESYNINWILISPNTFMDLLLAPNPENFGWEKAYRDKISVIYRRKS